MDQKKIGAFLKRLRMSKNLTQEELAEKFYVSARTVSRWETGINLPDICLLIELSDFYNCDVREIIEGEKKEMNNETKDVATKVANYATDRNEKSYKKVFKASIIGLIAFILFGIFKVISTNDAIDYISGFCLGVNIGTLIYIALYSTDVLQKIHKIKWLRILIVAICIATIIAFISMTIAYTSIV